jgi:hypothetical protein
MPGVQAPEVTADQRSRELEREGRPPLRCGAVCSGSDQGL